MKGGKDEGLRLFEKKEKIMKIRKRKYAMSAAFADRKSTRLNSSH